MLDICVYIFTHAHLIWIDIAVCHYIRQHTTNTLIQKNRSLTINCKWLLLFLFLSLSLSIDISNVKFTHTHEKWRKMRHKKKNEKIDRKSEIFFKSSWQTKKKMQENLPIRIQTEKRKAKICVQMIAVLLCVHIGRQHGSFARAISKKQSKNKHTTHLPAHRHTKCILCDSLLLSLSCIRCMSGVYVRA